MFLKLSLGRCGSIDKPSKVGLTPKRYWLRATKLQVAEPLSQLFLAWP